MSLTNIVFILLASAAFGLEPTNQNAREEKLRSGLIDAFQNIKRSKGLNEGINSDLIGSILTKEKSTTEDTFDLFADDDGLTFAEAFDSEPEKKSSSTEKSHNVQHIIKNAKLDKTTSKPSKDVLAKLTDSIRNTVNETRVLVLPNATVTGIEEMLRVFDADILVNQWPVIQKAVEGECLEDMQEYVDGLKENRLWALKSKCFNILTF